MELINENGKQLIRVGSGSDSKKVANSIIAHYETNKDCKSITIRSIGASALNQAVKAVIIANKHFVRKGQVISLIPGFLDLEEGADTMTSIQLKTKFVDF